MSRAKKFLREATSMGLIVVGILMARSTLADHYYVPSGSMEYTLIAGDRVFVDKRAYGFRIPFTDLPLTTGSPVSRGDVVIFDSPSDGTRLIKRIVAVGGDEVLLRDGHLAINGQWLGNRDGTGIERFADKKIRLNLADGGGPDLSITIPAGQVLAIGDHRGASRDGRIFGTVAEDAIYGRAIAVYYRRDDARLTDSRGFGWRKL